MYNNLKLEIRCPKCHHVSEMEAEFKIGYLNLDTYHIGEKITWADGLTKGQQNRPEGGNFTGDGYVECTRCNKDFWITINIENDIITCAQVNESHDGCKS
jgi:DNA-directed RNA polymerase subunit RPC12/RpoP